MPRVFSIGLALALFVLSASAGARAADSVGRYEAGPLIGFSAGVFDAIQGNDMAGLARLEYRENNDWWLKPLVNLTATTDGAVFFSGGLYAELFLSENLYVSPSFTPGLFLKGNGQDLGFPLEFRSQFEIGWRFHTGLRFSVSINHISNGGRARFNPGSESIAISMLIPFDKLFD